VVAEMADEIGVMYAGGFVERAAGTAIFDDPQHPYTWGLLRSIPRLDLPRGHALVPIAGRPPSLISPPSGCTFHPRCPHARPQCPSVEPPFEALADDPGHLAACVIEPQERRRIWQSLREGAVPERAALVPGDAELASEEQ
jgi:peptide/nickel transport system ATP-binding protein